MNNHNNYFVIVLLLFSSCLCEIINLSNNQREKFLTGFVEHYNSLPNQIYQSNEGILRSVQQVDDITFIIVAEIKATEIRDVEAFKKLECTATVQESGDDDVTVINHVCQELVPSTTPESTEDYRDTETQVEVTEGTVTSRHVQLENEVQSDTAVTSGEQFIAIPRDQPSSPCVGCTSHVNPQAPGVSDLAALGVRHLDLHEPSVNHSLDTVIDVERQVQVVNGVRYILTLLINSNNCTDVQTENCNFPKTCKVTILVKPWIKLPNGQNHRSILANNCTEPWLYGSDGEVLPEPSGDNDIQVRHHTDVQSVPNQERTLTEQELLSIQEQIIPNSEFKEPTESTRRFDTTSNTLDVSKQHVFKVESNKQTENSVPVTESEKKEQQSFNINLDTDKKKAIDDMLDFFDFSGFKPKTETEDVISRVRRSYDDDLQVLSLAKDYHGIKNSIENARFMYEMAQVMVDYLNEMDMEVKNRAVKDVVKAEDETENLQRFVYIQARVTIPCDKVECRPTDVVTQICNGVIDSTNVNSPQILNTFCYNENKERDFREVVREVPLDDPILKNLAEEALKKIETESKSKHAMKISKIVSANTQLTSGTLTKFSVIIENINCEKSVPLLLRMNCTVLQQPGSKICEVIVHERRWLNERKISYTCTDRPVEMRISKSTSITNNVTVDDPKVVEMLQEAIQYLETQSVKNNKQKIVNINSISSQIIAGFLTKIEFVVGYTNCTDESKTRDNAFQKCEVLKDEALRLCKAQIWDRSWIMDGRQVEVSCDDVLKSNEVQSARNKRSIDSIGGSVRRSGSKDSQIDYKKVAEDALQKFMLTSANRQHYVVLKVEKVKTQDEPGKLTRLFFSISPTNCFIQRDGLLSSPKCDVTNPKITFHCSSKVLQNVWIDKNQYFTDCKIQDNEENRNSDEIKERNLSNKKYYQLAEESLKKYMQNTEHTQDHKVVRLEKVTTQIVSGLLTNIDFIISPITQDGISNKTIKCHSKILEKQWLGKKDFNVSCQLKYQKKNEKKNLKNPKYMQMAVEALEKYIQNKPESDLLRVTFVDKVEEGEGKSFNIRFMASHNEDDDGDTLCYVQFPETQIPKKNMNVECHSIGTVLKQIQITEDDPKFIKYVQWAEESLNDYLQNMNSSDLYTIVRIESVNVLWDDSVKTLINFIISPIDLEYSALQGKMCQAEIKEQPWLNKKSKNVKCEPDEELYRAKRQVPGGETEKDPKDPAYMELAKQSLRKYLLENPRITQSSEVDPVVERVTTQVVAGSMTRIDFHFQASGTDSQQDHVTMKCHAEVWERPWLEPKAEFSVSCANADKRVKRHLKVPSHSMKHNSVALNYEVLDDEKNGNQKERDHVSSLRGHTEEVKDPSQPEYKILAEEALRKYELKSTVYHKVVEVKRVVTRVVSGLKYYINFNAAPTTCLLNVTSARARSCKPVADVILYCHTEIWDRPWLKRKKIDVNCYADDSEDSDIDLSSKPANANNNSSEIYLKLAEEASEKYLTTSNRKYVHKVTEILSGSEQVTNGSLITIVFSLSPTTCLRNDTTKKSCNLKQPLVVFHCSAEIRNSSSLEHEKEIEVTCKKRSEEKSKKEKRDIGTRHTRQTGDDDDEIDEETTFYYADRAIQHMNDNSNSNNLHKLISIHGVQSGIQMGTVTVQMYLEVAETFCLRHNRRTDLKNCEEMNGLNHRLCLARLWPSPDDELVVRHVTVVCDDDENFESITGVNIPELLKMSIAALERPPEAKYKLVHQGEPQVIPSLDSKFPFKLNFVVATTNCSKDVNLDTNPFQCYINTEIPAKSCHSFIWLETATKYIRYISAKCTPLNRVRRSSLDLANMTIDNSDIQRMVQASLDKLEMTSLHRYKQRVLQINSYSTKITSGKVTTIDFDVGYTSCLKYEWVANITSCDFLEHLPRRRCVAQIWERLWINNGQNIDVSCVDDETPLEAHIEFESAEMANELAREALKHIEAKYPHPNKQKVVRIFSLEKQVVAGIHYKMKIEVGFTDCVALSDQTDCKLLKDQIMNRFCRVNVWVRPWTDHPPNFRVSCDFQEATTYDLYHHVQAEHLFYNFLTTYNPSYVNDYSQMQKRFEIFKQNIKKIHELNVHEKGTATYGVTRFADLSYEEFRSTYMGLKTNLTNENQVPMKMADIPDIKVPVNFDWREYDAVTDVKDQGSCGSCWAFSVTGNIEGQWKMQSGKLVSLSEQELVDCDKMDDGCNGGLPDNAYRAIEQMGGLELESDYPYEGVDEKCAFNKTLAKVQISGAVNITKNETGMAQWLVHNGPISIGINANAMQFYMGGISHPWKMLCNPTNLDHGVLIVGYGIKDYPLFHKKLPYWIVKNSWGKSWGEQGYYRVYRGDGTCGVNQMASSAVI